MRHASPFATVARFTNRACLMPKQDPKARANSMNYKEAKEEEVFVIRNERIVATTLYDHVMESAAICCRHNEVTRVLHIVQTTSMWANRKECADCPHSVGLRCTAYEECEFAKRWELRAHLGYQSGGGCSVISMFNNEDDAEQEMFERIEATDFQQDVSRDTWYCFDRAWAVIEMSERNNLDILTQTSILKHRAQLDEARARKEAARKNAKKELSDKEQEIMYDIAEMYSTMIDPVEGESYKDTCNRLSERVGERIGSRVFHMAVKIRREEY